MTWSLPLPWSRKEARAAAESEAPRANAWERHVAELKRHGIPEPGVTRDPKRKPATLADEQALYDVVPSFVDLLPWVEYLPDSKCLLLEDGESVAAFFELTPIGTEGRETHWLWQARDALENALQDSFDELDEHPWVVQLYAQDEADWESYLGVLHEYIHPRARGSAFSDFYLRFLEHHLRAIAKPGGLFEDTTVTRLPWRGQTRRVRMVVYRRAPRASRRRDQSPQQALATVCDRLVGGLANAGVEARRLGAADIHAWLLRWFNPNPSSLGSTTDDRERFYQLAAYPDEADEGEIELASGTDFAQRLFFGQPRSDVANGLWFFGDQPHRVIVLDRLRAPPTTGHLTGETRKGGDAVNALFDQMPEDTVMCLTLVATPQDALEAHLNYLSKKAVGDTLASEQTRQDVQQARSLIGSSATE
jgi:conjugative transfer ATPase